jgi:uncharacterized membrane protein
MKNGVVDYGVLLSRRGRCCGFETIKCCIMPPRSTLSSQDDRPNSASNNNNLVKKFPGPPGSAMRSPERKLFKSLRRGVAATTARSPKRAPRNQHDNAPVSATAISSTASDDALVASAAMPAEESSSDALNGATNGLSGNNSMNLASVSPYSGIGGGMMGMYGSPYGGYGMMGSPMMMGGLGGVGPFSGLYQVLFGVQNVVFSLGQVVSILGMNQQAMQQVFDSISSALDQAIASYHELRALEAIEKEQESEEQKKRRRRLKTMRWALVAGTSWLVYKLLWRLVTSSRRKRLRHGEGRANGGGLVNQYSPGNAISPYASGYGGGYGNSSMMHSGYGSSGLYGGGPYGGGPYGGGGYYGGGGGHF